MKTFWRVSLSCLLWTCTGIATAVSATPYTFNETKQNLSSNANSVNGRAPQYPIYPDVQNDSGLPQALRGTDEPIEFKNSRLEQTASNVPFMKEEGPGGREFSPNGGSITSSPDYRFSSASQSQLMPLEEWSGNRMKGQGNSPRNFRNRNNRNRNFQGGGIQSAHGIHNYDYINDRINTINNYSNTAFVNNVPNNNSSSRNNSSNNFSGNNNFNNPRNNPRNRNRNNPDPTADTGIRQPDRVADNPQVDGDGVRHFSNGKHLDLSKMSLDDAIGATNSSADEGRIVANARNVRHLPYQAIVDQPADRYTQPLNIPRRPARDGFGNGPAGSFSYRSP
jgi:hypothetical protein